MPLEKRTRIKPLHNVAALCCRRCTTFVLDGHSVPNVDRPHNKPRCCPKPFSSVPFVSLPCEVARIGPLPFRKLLSGRASVFLCVSLRQHVRAAIFLMPWTPLVGSRGCGVRLRRKNRKMVRNAKITQQMASQVQKMHINEKMQTSI